MLQKEPSSIASICATINSSVDGNEQTKLDLWELANDLSIASKKAIPASEFDEMCKLVYKLSTLQGAKGKQFEKMFWQTIDKLSSTLPQTPGFEIQPNEELKPAVQYQSEIKTNLARLLQLACDVLSIKPGKTQTSDTRVGSALGIITILSEHYTIVGIQKSMAQIVSDKNEKIKIMALQTLENYFACNEEAIDQDLLNDLEATFDKTDDEYVAIICLNIKGSAGLIDEKGAISALNDWRKTHYDDPFDGDLNDDMEDDEFNEFDE